MTVTRKKKEDINMVVKTVVEAQDIFDKAWEGFKGVDWKKKQVYHASYKLTTHLTMETKASLQDQQNVHFTSKKL